MKKLWNFVGVAAFWLSWPALWLYLRGTKRTRVVVVSGKNNILLVKGWYGAGQWGLPGGGVKRGETPVQAAMREIEEETGLKLEADQLTFADQLKAKEYGLRCPSGIYLVKLKNQPKLKPRKWELRDVAWVSKDDLQGLGPLAKQLLADWS